MAFYIISTVCTQNTILPQLKLASVSGVNGSDVSANLLVLATLATTCKQQRCFDVNVMEGRDGSPHKP